MKEKYFWVTISPEDQEQADMIMNTLLNKKLITGGQMLKAPARFLWKGEVVDMDYYNLTSFTVEKNKKRIIEVVENMSIEEVPMVSFVAFEGNEKLLRWIDNTID